MRDTQQQQPPERQDRKRLLEPKDYLTITLSTLAFVVSIGSVYFNIPPTDESIVLVYNQVPVVRLTQDRLILPREHYGEIGIINSGNRTAFITDVYLFYIQPKTDDVICDLET